MKTERKKRDKKHLKGRILRSISLILICSMILSTLIGYLYFNQVVRKQRLEEEKNRLMQVGNQIAFQAEDNRRFAQSILVDEQLQYLLEEFNCVGIGHVYLDGCHYWVEEFAYRTSVNTTETTANDSEQIMSLSVPKSKVTGLKVAFDKTSYSLRTGESTEVKLTAKLTVFGSDTIVTDLPAISVNDPSIATYSNGKITGVAEGSTTLTASLYGLTAADMPTINVYRCEHHWDQGEIITEATCTEEGEKKFTCSICGDEKTEKVSATGHQHTEIRNKKEATCKETGYSGDTWCKDCGKKILSGQTIAKTENHSWDAGKVTTKATCTEEGEKTFTCSICGNTKTEKVSTTDHQHMEIRNQKNPTCKEAGYSGDTYCADCGVKISSGKTIAKTKNHNWDGGVITTEPTCTERGEKTFTCTICGNTDTKKVNATGHRYGAYKIVKEPTNERKGLKAKTCSVCGKIVYEGIPKTNSSPTDSSETNPDQNPQTSQKATRKIKLNRRKLTLKKGKSFRLKVTLTPADSQDKITYKTSNKKIATVSKTGKIKAKKKGKVKITVISGKKKAVCTVKVK